MTAHEPDGLVWRRSSYSGDTGNCVEIAWPDRQVAVRDSKQPTGLALAFPIRAWHTFLADQP